MRVEDLITDAAIEIVFDNTNFGSRTPRDLIAKDLDQISRGQHVGHTMQCCLMELGLIYRLDPGFKRKYGIAPLGRKYLEIVKDHQKINA